MNILEVNNVSFSYTKSGDLAIDQLSLDIPKGAITGLLGPNGAGKTTLIQLICSMFTPLHGNITYPAFNKNDEYTIKKNTGFVPQQDGLFGDLTLFQNIIYFGQLYNLSLQEIKLRLNKYCDWLQLTPHIHKKIKFFSGGMNRRANIVTALIHDPQLIILDEPTAGVDVQSRALIHDVIKTLKAEQKSIIYTSHLLSEAESLCDYIYIIDYGKIIVSGNIQSLKLIDGYTSLEQYFLSVTGNLVRD